MMARIGVTGGPAVTDGPDILGPGGFLGAYSTVFLSITMDRTYLARPGAPGGQRVIAIVETYDSDVHHDGPDMVGACTHDEPDILLPMNRTYLGRALTMNRTYHYR